jgi:hypothetical protein
MKHAIIALTFLAILTPNFILAQQRKGTQTIEAHYLVRPPLVINGSASNGGPKGVEGEIFDAFVSWLKNKKELQVQVNFKSHTDFDAFYQSVREGKDNVIGFGNATITEKRKKEVQFSPPYLKNISVLVTSGGVPTISKTEEIKELLEGKKGISSLRSVHAMYLDEIREKHIPALGIEFVSDQNAIPRKISMDAQYFGYMDIISYWYYVKQSSSFLKFHRFMNRGDERMGFMLPLESALMPLVAEFFESGFGFTSTKSYKEILERYLGYEIMSTVEVN